ncbi:MAG: hypothetical protein P8Z49_06525 [Acidobacteriota bacterium]|jgi:hypothetical protein
MAKGPLHILAAAFAVLGFAMAAHAGAAPLPPSLRDARASAAARLCGLYAVPPSKCAAPILIRLAPSGDRLPPFWRGLPSYAAGAADPEAGRIIIVLPRCGNFPYGAPGQTLAHELSHVLLYRSLGYEPPRWLDEGLAMRAGGSLGAAQDWYLALALPRAASGRYTLADLTRGFRGSSLEVRRSYALSRAFVGDLFPRDRAVTRFVLTARRLGSVDAAFRFQFGASPEVLFSRWARRKSVFRQWLQILVSQDLLWFLITLLFLAAAAAVLLRRFKTRRLRAGGEDVPDWWREENGN